MYEYYFMRHYYHTTGGVTGDTSKVHLPHQPFLLNLQLEVVKFNCKYSFHSSKLSVNYNFSDWLVKTMILKNRTTDLLCDVKVQ